MAQGGCDAVFGRLDVMLRQGFGLLVAGVFALDVEQVKQGAAGHSELLLIAFDKFFTLCTLLAGDIGTVFGRCPFGVGQADPFTRHEFNFAQGVFGGDSQGLGRAHTSIGLLTVVQGPAELGLQFGLVATGYTGVLALFF